MTWWRNQKKAAAAAEVTESYFKAMRCFVFLVETMGNDVLSSLPGNLFLFSLQNKILSSQRAKPHDHTILWLEHVAENFKQQMPNKCYLMRFAKSNFSEDQVMLIN